MLPHAMRSQWKKITSFASATALSAFAMSAPVHAADPDTAVDALATATPIKHLIIIVGENRSFDNLFATYVPKHEDERVLNLLSEKIIHANGTAGSHCSKAHQFQITSAPNGGKYFSSADLSHKTLYGVLPPPDVGGVGAVSPYAGILSIPGGNPGLPPQDEFRFG